MTQVVRLSCLCFALAGGFIIATSPARADPQEPAAAVEQPEEVAEQAAVPGEPPKHAWRIEFNAWIWLVGLNGDIGVQGQEAEVDASIVDIVDNSDSIVAFSGRLEIGFGPVAGFIDGYYSDLGVDDATGPSGLSSIDVTLKQGIVDFGTMFRVLDREPDGSAAANHRNLTVDLYAGGRYTSLDLELDPANAGSQSRDIDWFDPILGARLVAPFAEHWHFSLGGDVGGFGVSSDFTWSATALLGYDFHVFGQPSSILAGYRAIGWDYDSDDRRDFQWEIIQHGVLLGFSMRF